MRLVAFTLIIMMLSGQVASAASVANAACVVLLTNTSRDLLANPRDLFGYGEKLAEAITDHRARASTFIEKSDEGGYRLTEDARPARDKALKDFWDPRRAEIDARLERNRSRLRADLERGKVHENSILANERRLLSTRDWVLRDTPPREGESVLDYVVRLTDTAVERGLITQTGGAKALFLQDLLGAMAHANTGLIDVMLAEIRVEHPDNYSEILATAEARKLARELAKVDAQVAALKLEAPAVETPAPDAVSEPKPSRWSKLVEDVRSAAHAKYATAGLVIVAVIYWYLDDAKAHARASLKR
ncbi:MAG: hypothetical protein HY075_06650 [Deltaproteobacteria bacterium]|nr:hypothetical protein [Deltaproteobacteria bacterium]